MFYIYNSLHKDQLHVSAFYNGHCKRPKHVVELYVVNFIYIYITSNKVVLD